LGNWGGWLNSIYFIVWGGGFVATFCKLMKADIWLNFIKFISIAPGIGLIVISDFMLKNNGM
jgi:hypothetical protein